jgi:hypothetical protein
VEHGARAVSSMERDGNARLAIDKTGVSSTTDDDRPWGSWCASGDAATSGVATEAMLGDRCATLGGSDSEGNQRARPSSERPLPAKAA